MTNEILIYKFLNKNTSLYLGDRIKLYHKLNNSSYDTNTYLVLLSNIFPELTFDTEKIFFKWFDKKIATIENDVINVYKTSNKKKGIDSLINTAIKKLELKPYISEQYISEKLSEQYIIDIIIPSIDDLMDKNFNMTSLDLLKFIIKKFKANNINTASYVKDKVLNHYKRYIIPHKIKTYLSTLDLTLGSKRLILDMNIHFKDDKIYFSGEMMDAFKIFYRENYINPKLTNFLESKIDEPIQNINELILQFGDLDKEIEEESLHCTNIIHSWFLDTKIKSKLDDLFSQFVITMGKTNWVVTWIGHGPITERKILDEINISEEDNEYIIDEYEKWYSEAILLASEKYMLRGGR